MAEMSKTTRIIDSMVGRRTNNDILRMISRYRNTRINTTEYCYLMNRMSESGIGDFDENEVADYHSPIISEPTHKEPRDRYRKNKQQKSRGKPKRKR